MAKKVRVIETESLDQLLEWRGNDIATPRLILDTRKKIISVDTHFPGDGRTFAEERGDVLVFEIPMLRGETADRLMHEIAPLAERVCDDEDEAIASISSVIDGYEPDLEFWFADDWFEDTNQRLADALGITQDTTDDEIQALAASEEHTAGAVIIGAVEYLEKVRASLSKEAE